MTEHIESYASSAEDVGDGALAATPPVGRTRREKVRGVLFKGLAVLYSLFLLLGMNLLFLIVALYWLPVETIVSLIPDFDAGELVHRLHGMALTTFAWGMFIGTIVQLRRPERRLAPMLMALAVPTALIAGELATGTYTVSGTAPLLFPLLLIAVLHPRARDLVRVRRLDGRMAGLTVLAAGPLLVFASRQAHLQRLAVPGDPHAETGHWALMASFALLVVVWGLIGASDRPSWRLVAWMAGLAAAMYGLQSLLFPRLASAAPATWAIVALVWALAYLTATEWRVRSIS